MIFDRIRKRGGLETTDKNAEMSLIICINDVFILQRISGKYLNNNLVVNMYSGIECIALKID